MNVLPNSPAQQPLSLKKKIKDHLPIIIFILISVL